MSNVLELPVENDFLKVDTARILHAQNDVFTVIKYNASRINLKSVLDFRAFDEKMIVFDEEKKQEYTAQLDYWNKSRHTNQQVVHTEKGMTMVDPPQPQPPVKEIRIQGTVVIYHNNSERILMMPLEEWENKYFGYLQEIKLNILK